MQYIYISYQAASGAAWAGYTSTGAAGSAGAAAAVTPPITTEPTRSPDIQYHAQSCPPGYKIRIGDLAGDVDQGTLYARLWDSGIDQDTYDAIACIDVKSGRAASGASYATVTITDQVSAEKVYALMFRWRNWVNLPGQAAGYRMASIKWLAIRDQGPVRMPGGPRQWGQGRPPFPDPAQSSGPPSGSNKMQPVGGGGGPAAKTRPRAGSAYRTPTSVQPVAPAIPAAAAPQDSACAAPQATAEQVSAGLDEKLKQAWTDATEGMQMDVDNNTMGNEPPGPEAPSAATPLVQEVQQPDQAMPAARPPVEDATGETGQFYQSADGSWRPILFAV
jgi:hypothetical protein